MTTMERNCSVLFSHSVSESQVISCDFAHDLFQIALQVRAQDFLRLARSQEYALSIFTTSPWVTVSGLMRRLRTCGLDCARSGGLVQNCIKISIRSRDPHVFTSASDNDETPLEEIRKKGQEVPPTAPTNQLLWNVCQYRCWASHFPNRARWHLQR